MLLSVCVCPKTRPGGSVLSVFCLSVCVPKLDRGLGLTLCLNSRPRGLVGCGVQVVLQLRPLALLLVREVGPRQHVAKVHIASLFRVGNKEGFGTVRHKVKERPVQADAAIMRRCSRREQRHRSQQRVDSPCFSA
jgi:hypothetical protein